MSAQTLLVLSGCTGLSTPYIRSYGPERFQPKIGMKNWPQPGVLKTEWQVYWESMSTSTLTHARYGGCRLLVT